MTEPRVSRIQRIALDVGFAAGGVREDDALRDHAVRAAVQRGVDEMLRSLDAHPGVAGQGRRDRRDRRAIAANRSVGARRSRAGRTRRPPTSAGAS